MSNSDGNLNPRKSAKRTLKTISLVVLTVVGVTTIILNWKTIFNSNIEKSIDTITIHGFVYRDNKENPCSKCTVVFKEIQSIVPEKTVNDNGYYVSDPVSRRLMPSGSPQIDLTVLIKYSGKVIFETTKRIDFTLNEKEYSFGDIIVAYKDKPTVESKKKAASAPSSVDSHDKTVIVKGDNNGPINVH